MCVRAPILSCAGDVEANTFDGKQCISQDLRTRRLLHTSNVTNRFVLPPRSRMVATKCMVPHESEGTNTHWHPVPVQARPAEVCSKKATPARLPMRCLCTPVQPCGNRSQHVATNPTANRRPWIQPCVSIETVNGPHIQKFVSKFVGDSTRDFHDFPLVIPPPRPRKQLCTRSCSNKHTHRDVTTLTQPYIP
jgi:hypothetical protein